MNYGVAVDAALDAAAALARPRAVVPSSGVADWDGQFRFALSGGQELVLADENAALFDAMLGIYLVAGMEGVTEVHDLVAAEVDAFTRAPALDLARQRLGGPYGVDDGPQREVDAVSAALLRAHPALETHPDIIIAQRRALAFRARLVAAIDQLTVAEGEAQRWFEDRLIAAIEADLQMQRVRLAELWAAYGIRRADTKALVAIAAARSADGLEIPPGPQAERVEVTRAGGTGMEDVHAILPRLHRAGALYYRFVQAVSIRNARSGGEGSVPGSVPHTQLRDLLAESGAEHFAIYTCYRRVVQRSVEELFDPARVQARLIDALINAHAAIEPMIARIKADRLFVGADQPPPPGGARPAPRPMTAAIAARYSVADSGVQASPWLQSPFFERLRAVAAGQDGSNAGRGNLGEVSVHHLEPLFAAPDDRQLLDAVTTPGSFTWRARQEMLAALAEREQDVDRWRRQIAAGVSAIGLVGAPFTGGLSFGAAAIVDALFVAERTSEEVALWIGRREYHRLVVDAVGDAAWSEPEVAELTLLLIEAGFEIMSDVADFGSPVGIMDAILVLGRFGELMADVPDKGATQ